MAEAPAYMLDSKPLSPVDLTPFADPVSEPFSYPPGLIGEIARYAYAAAIRPVHEIALAGAIATLAGIVGRQYNISSTGLNLYILLLARTGTGKESIASAIDRLFAEVHKTVPAAETFLGPSRFASGQALNKRFQKQPCFVSILGEFGDTMKRLSGPRANGCGDAWFQDGAARHGSKSQARKRASAMIAKIPLPLSRHIAAVYRPGFTKAEALAASQPSTR